MILIMEAFFLYVIVFLLCMSICSLLRECILFVRCFIRTEEYILSTKRMIALWASISYIITFIAFI